MQPTGPSSSHLRSMRSSTLSIRETSPTTSHPSKHEFTLTGLVHCGHCGSLMVGELKKGRYVYYHCTGNRGRCGDPYVREEQLLRELSGRLSDLVVAPETMVWLEQTMSQSDQTEQGARE